jgi:predicted dehydrogenase
MVGLRIHAGGLEPDKNHGLIKSFKAHPEVEIAAYCEWAPDQAAALAALQRADPQAAICHSVEELLNRVDFDLAVVMLPPSEAIGAALQLAAAGKHLFVEKQGARRAAEFLPLCDRAKAGGLILQVGYPWPSHPVARTLKQHLEEGVLGRLVDMEARLVTVGVGPGLRDPNHWMYQAKGEGGGILHMESGHWLTLFRYFSGGEVKSVTALCQRVIGNIEEGLEDVATVALEFTNGVHACLHMGYLLPGVGTRNDLHFALRGTAGAATWPLTGEFTIASATPAWQGAPMRTFHMEPTTRPVYADQWGYEFVADFVRSIQSGQSPLVDGQAGYRVLQIIDAAYESSRTGRRVELV